MEEVQWSKADNLKKSVPDERQDSREEKEEKHFMRLRSQIHIILSSSLDQTSLTQQSA